VRTLAGALLTTYAERATSIAELVGEPRFRGLDVAEVNAAGRMHPYLAALPGLSYVEYPEEDVQALSWAAGSFDLLLTSETLEHVPDLDAALRETRRVLRPGGRHVLTVPVDPRLTATSSRSGLPPQHHGRGGGPFSLVTRKTDLLAHWDIGADFAERVAAAGFDVETVGSGVDVVFVATARA
jgi:SAM-dependent methyltransferase